MANIRHLASGSGLGLLVLLAFFGPAHAGADCEQQYAGARAPVIVNPKLASRTTPLCYQAFAVMYSGVTRTPLWSAEHLLSDNVAAAQSLSRQNAFHAEANLPAGERAELKDYARSGFDRGHMAPNGDMPTREAQYNSFTLANMVPQNPNNNRYIWEGIESAVRRLAKSDGELFVLSGPAFIGADLQQVGNVLVPTHLFKVVYRPRTNEAGAYFLKNEATKEYMVVSVAQLEKTIGIDLLPGVLPRVKAVAAELPRPTPHNESEITGDSRHRRTHGNGPDDYRMNARILDAVAEWLKFLKK